jgi:AcrR family transcriptional regulator
MQSKARPVLRRTSAQHRLLAAAKRVFARDGLDGATTRAIAREAGVNEVTLFRHFGTKERLIEAVVGRAFGERAEPRAGTDRRRTSGPGEDGPAARPSLAAALEDFARRYEARLRENLPLVLTVLGEIHRHRECERQALNGIFRPMRAALIASLEAARDRGELAAGVEPAPAADLFAGAILAGVLRQAKTLAHPEYDLAAYRRLGLEVFLRGLAPGAPDRVAAAVPAPVPFPR